MIERYHLRYFLAVLDAGNFSRAAVACNVSQPTLSAGIAKLEQTLGHPVFRRSNRRIELTEAGARLAAHARDVEAGFARAERSVHASGAAQPLRLGVLVTVPSAWTRAVVRAAGPDYRIEVVEGRERDLREKLARGRIDLALTILGPGNGEAAFAHAEGYSLALAADHPLATREAIRAEELVNEPMIVRRHCEVLPEASRHLTARGVRPHIPARTTSDEKALAYIAAGLGMTVMPDCFTAPGVARVRLEDFTFQRRIGLVRPAGADPDAFPTDALAASLAGASGEH